MIHEIGPIVQEDKDAGKIRRALVRGAGGVIVDSAAPAEVLQEGAHYSERPGAGTPMIVVDEHAPGHCRWDASDGTLPLTRNWLMEEFKWAAAAGLCRKPEAAQGYNKLVRLWANEAQFLPWHIDRGLSETYPDIHIHLAGQGMKVAAPRGVMALVFSDNQTSPHLELPHLSVRNIPYKNADKIMLKKLNEYLRERDVPLLKLQPGQMLFFNEKCLHVSAGQKSPRLRAAIF